MERLCQQMLCAWPRWQAPGTVLGTVKTNSSVCALAFTRDHAEVGPSGREEAGVLGPPPVLLLTPADSDGDGSV